jgi:hypothetical protein
MTTPITNTLAYGCTVTAAACLVIACVAIWAVNTFHPEQKVTNNPLRIVALGAWSLTKSLLMIPLAVLTLDSDGWGGQRNQKTKEGPK